MKINKDKIRDGLEFVCLVLRISVFILAIVAILQGRDEALKAANDRLLLLNYVAQPTQDSPATQLSAPPELYK